MLVAWVIYALLVGVLVAGGALLIETVLRAFGAPTRRLWLAAMGATLLVPFAAWMGWGPGSSDFAVETFRGVAPVLEVAEGVNPTAEFMGGVMWLGWVLGSGVLLLALTIQWSRIRQGRSEWTSAEIHGTPVLVSEDVGPAVVGFAPGTIVVPRWLLEADASVKRLIMAHEREHLRSRDPAMMLAGMLMVIVMPWNFALWWMAQRLRLAIEVDCDERVLRSGRWDVRTYGATLLSVGHRRSRGGYALAAFSRPRSSLEHRILEMTRPLSEKRVAMAGGMLVVLTGLVLTAWTLPSPNSIARWTSEGYFCEAPSRVGIYEGRNH